MQHTIFKNSGKGPKNQMCLCMRPNGKNTQKTTTIKASSWLQLKPAAQNMF